MKVKYLGRHKKKSKSTERFGDIFYKLIFEKLDGEKITVYAFSGNMDTKQWNFIEEERLRIGDILEISIETDRIERFGHYEEYCRLLGFQVIKGVWYIE